MVGDQPPEPDWVPREEPPPEGEPLAVFGRLGKRAEFDVSTHFGFVMGFYRAQPALLPFPSRSIVEMIDVVDGNRTENFKLWYDQLNALRLDQQEQRLQLMIGPVVDFAAGLRYEMSAMFRGAIALALLLDEGLYSNITDEKGVPLYPTKAEFIDDFIQRWKLGDSKGRTMRLIKAAKLWLNLNGRGLPVPPNLSRLEDLVPFAVDPDEVAERYERLVTENRKLNLSPAEIRGRGGPLVPSYTELQNLARDLRHEKLDAELKKQGRLTLNPKERLKKARDLVADVTWALSRSDVGGANQLQAIKAKMAELTLLLAPVPKPSKKPTLIAADSPDPKDPVELLPRVRNFQEVDLSTLTEPIRLLNADGHLQLKYPSKIEGARLAVDRYFAQQPGWTVVEPGTRQLELSKNPGEENAQISRAEGCLLALATGSKLPRNMMVGPARPGVGPAP